MHLIVPGLTGSLPFGAKVIGEILASTPHLRLVQELRTPLYRIQLFQRPLANPLASRRRRTPDVVEFPNNPPRYRLKSPRKSSGTAGACSGRTQTVMTDRLPILMYHRVAPTLARPATARFG